MLSLSGYGRKTCEKNGKHGACLRAQASPPAIHLFLSPTMYSEVLLCLWYTAPPHIDRESWV